MSAFLSVSHTDHKSKDTSEKTRPNRCVFLRLNFCGFSGKPYGNFHWGSPYKKTYLKGLVPFGFPLSTKMGPFFETSPNPV